MSQCQHKPSKYFEDYELGNDKEVLEGQELNGVKDEILVKIHISNKEPAIIWSS